MTSRAIDFRLLAGVVLTAAVTACSSGGGSSTPQATAPPPIVVTHTYPANVAAPSGGGTAWDITQVTTTLTSVEPGAAGNLYDTLQINITFQQDISSALPAPNTRLTGGTQLGVGTAFDPTGNGKGTIQGCATAGTTPFTYATDEGNFLGRLSDGNYALLDSNGVQGGEATTSVAGHILTQVYKLSAVGVTGPHTPSLKVQFLVFNGLGQSVTKCIPIDGSEISVVGP
jgi:hypothetical protein